MKNIFNSTKEKRRKIFKFFVVILLVSFSILFLISIIIQVNEFRQGCYIEKHLFLSDEIISNHLCSNEECLFMNTIDLNTGKERVLFFGGEKTLFSKRVNAKNGQEINVKWCPTEVGDRIKGITKI